MHEPASIATGGSVGQVELDLADVEAGVYRVDRHAQLAAEAARERETGSSRSRAEIALPGERLGCFEATAKADQPPRASFASPKPPPTCSTNEAIARSESVAMSGLRSPSRSASQRSSGPEWSDALGCGQRLALAEPGSPDDRRTGAERNLAGPVTRTVVTHDDVDSGEAVPEPGDERTDPLLLVARRNED